MAVLSEFVSSDALFPSTCLATLKLSLELAFEGHHALITAFGPIITDWPRPSGGGGGACATATLFYLNVEW